MDINTFITVLSYGTAFVAGFIISQCLSLVLHKRDRAKRKRSELYLANMTDQEKNEIKAKVAEALNRHDYNDYGTI